MALNWRASRRAACGRSCWICWVVLSSRRAASSGWGVMMLAGRLAGCAVQLVLQRGLGRDQVQGIGIDHDIGFAVQRARQDVMRMARGTQAGPDHQGRAGAEFDAVGQAEHQFGVLVVIGRAIVDEGHIHPSGPTEGGGARRQHGRAGHAARAADHDDVAVAALVAVVGTRLGGGETLRAIEESAPAGRWLDASAAFDHDQAAVVAAVTGMQSGLVADEGQRMGGLYRAPSRPPTMLPVSALRPLGTSMDSTGQRRLLTYSMIARKAGPGGASGRCRTVRRSPAPRTCPQRPPPLDELQLGLARPRQGTARIGRLAVFIGVQLHAHFDAGFFQQAGRFQRITTIVAGAGQDQYRGRGGGGRAQQLLGLLGDGGTGALHEGVGGRADSACCSTWRISATEWSALMIVIAVALELSWMKACCGRAPGSEKAAATLCDFSELSLPRAGTSLMKNQHEKCARPGR
jgi:hypothetical protein